jgi:hypothetical protein
VRIPDGDLGVGRLLKIPKGGQKLNGGVFLRFLGYGSPNLLFLIPAWNLSLKTESWGACVPYEQHAPYFPHQPFQTHTVQQIKCFLAMLGPGDKQVAL